jgi:hypothetical protein
MTLENYTHRLVAMSPDTTAYDAIRAMEDNHIGAELLGEVVRAQLAEPSRLKFAGQRGPGAPARPENWPRVRCGTRGHAPRMSATGRAMAKQLRQEVASAFRRITGG